MIYLSYLSINQTMESKIKVKPSPKFDDAFFYKVNNFIDKKEK
jgi:hypothetical protein